MTSPVPAYVGLGANLGDAAAMVRSSAVALAELPRTSLLRVSRLYRTAAWGNEDQPEFVNAVAELRTALSPSELLKELLELERRSGRRREAAVHWGPRTLDLDLLLYAEQSIDLPELRVPHPYLHQRAFALVPLAEIAPEAVIPGIGTVGAILRTLNTDTVIPLGG
ncbi:MAG: 2-amino-4-hydroxy-6-hydroxymethyldihydropteridine diphosphokinase [Xanthomonadaceae bacterium]|jgi:2-amino-4-hydroxy-6-hydroxymethyldihydropteridine diphosphokinase|nr:2-amino-4-hydroxy-6-hydroxymethyldihydropteridine diphosphokinase [Xanthomonadaceae bacterium]